MKRLATLLLLIAAPAAVLPAQQQSEPGFSVTAEPFSYRLGRFEFLRGAVLAFSTDASDTTGFVAEVTYRVAGDPKPRRAFAYCMKRNDGRGAQWLELGEVTEISVNAYEIKGHGRFAVTTKQVPQ
jgi:hypothetical protein